MRWIALVFFTGCSTPMTTITVYGEHNAVLTRTVIVLRVEYPIEVKPLPVSPDHVREDVQRPNL